MNAPRIFTTEYYERMRSLEAGGWWNAGMRDVAADLLRLAGLPQAGVLLDVGCGSGQTLQWFLGRHPGWHGIGLDVASEGLDAAHRAGQGGVIQASALDIPLEDRSVDLIITLDVLQHLPLPHGDQCALEEMRRVLRPGGYLLVRTNAQAFPGTPDDPAADFRRYRATQLRNTLAAAGFRVHRLSRINALLGLAEIPRELGAHRRDGARYHGILADSDPRGRLDGLKRFWLRLEGRAVRHGVSLPTGRSIIALAQA